MSDLYEVNVEAVGLTHDVTRQTNFIGYWLDALKVKKWKSLPPEQRLEALLRLLREMQPGSARRVAFDFILKYAPGCTIKQIKHRVDPTMGRKWISKAQVVNQVVKALPDTPDDLKPLYEKYDPMFHYFFWMAQNFAHLAFPEEIGPADVVEIVLAIKSIHPDAPMPRDRSAWRSFAARMLRDHDYSYGSPLDVAYGEALNEPHWQGETEVVFDVVVEDKSRKEGRLRIAVPAWWLKKFKVGDVFVSRAYAG